MLLLQAGWPCRKRMPAARREEGEGGADGQVGVPLLLPEGPSQGGVPAAGGPEGGGESVHPSSAGVDRGPGGPSHSPPMTEARGSLNTKKTWGRSPGGPLLCPIAPAFRGPPIPRYWSCCPRTCGLSRVDRWDHGGPPGHASGTPSPALSLRLRQCWASPARLGVTESLSADVRVAKASQVPVQMQYPVVEASPVPVQTRMWPG